VLIIRRSKLHYTASGIITPVGGRLLHGLREDWSMSWLVTGVSVQLVTEAVIISKEVCRFYGNSKDIRGCSHKFLG